MKKSMLIFYSLLLFSLTTNIGNAGELSSSSDISNKAVVMDQGTSVEICDKAQLKNAALEKNTPELPYLLQSDQQACLDKCTQEYDSCVSGAGDSADSQFRCGEKRWMCTRSCDNAFAPQLEL